MRKHSIGRVRITNGGPSNMFTSESVARRLVLAGTAKWVGLPTNPKKKIKIISGAPAVIVLRETPRLNPPRVKSLSWPGLPCYGQTEYTAWRDAVLTRDGYRCIFCGSTNDLEADHIKPKAIYPHLKYDVSNGRTLCHDCHSKTATYAGRVHSLIAVEVEALTGVQ